MRFHPNGIMFLTLLALLPLIWWRWFAASKHIAIRFSSLDHLRRCGRTWAVRARHLVPGLRTLAVGLPWLASELDEVEALFGGDAFPYGLGPNRKVLETTIAYLGEQGLLTSEVGTDALFAPETVDLDLAT